MVCVQVITLSLNVLSRVCAKYFHHIAGAHFIVDVFEVMSVHYTDNESIILCDCEACYLSVIFKFVCVGWHVANVRGTLWGRFTLLKNA